MNENSPASIRESQSIARLSRTFSRSLSAVDLAEPLPSLDATQPVEAGKELLQTSGLSVLGVRGRGVIAGWVAAGDLTDGTLGDHARPFRPKEVFHENASLAAVLGAMAATGQVFVQWLGEVAGVITRRDLQKPPLRMWLFGAITVFDANMTWAIEKLHEDESWKEHLSAGRLEKAVTLWEERRRTGSECRLVDCLQIADKAGLLTRDRAHIAAIEMPSRREAERLMRAIEALRNHLAHAQQLEEEHLATAAKLAAVIDTVLRAEGVQRIVAERTARTAVAAAS